MNDNATPQLAAGGERGKMRACDADRDRVVEWLSLAYSEGRLSKDEYDGRLAPALGRAKVPCGEVGGTRLHAAARWGSPRMIRTGQCT